MSKRTVKSPAVVSSTRSEDGNTVTVAEFSAEAFLDDAATDIASHIGRGLGIFLNHQNYGDFSPNSPFADGFTLAASPRDRGIETEAYESEGEGRFIEGYEGPAGDISLTLWEDTPECAVRCVLEDLDEIAAHARVTLAQSAGFRAFGAAVGSAWAVTEGTGGHSAFRTAAPLAGTDSPLWGYAKELAESTFPGSVATGWETVSDAFGWHVRVTLVVEGELSVPAGDPYHPDAN